MTRRRLDAELVRRGLLPSRRDAVAAIEAGRVTVSGAPASKPTRLIAPDEALLVHGPPPRYVSRGGEKLDAALDVFGIDVVGRRSLDVGASTGGFTDCLLQRGVEHVVALDVGHAQLHERIRSDRRVTVIERCNFRTCDVASLGDPFGVVVLDVSFISIGSLATQLLSVLEPDGDLVALVKPQFEAGRAEVSKGRGIIVDPAIHERVCDEVSFRLTGQGATVLGRIDSPLLGGSGNREFLMHVRHR